MSEGLMVTSERGLAELLGCVERLVVSVQSAPLTRDQLMQRWGLTEEKTLLRWCDELGLRPFEGRGKAARFRMSAVLRAEARGEQLNGGEGL